MQNEGNVRSCVVVHRRYGDLRGRLGKSLVRRDAEEFVTEGDGIEIDGLTPLEDLPIEQQTRIKNELDALPEEYLDVLRNYGGKEKFNLS